MKLRVTRYDGDPHLIERPPELTAGYVCFRMDGSTAVLQEGDLVKDLFDVTKEVRELPFVQATEVDA